MALMVRYSHPEKIWTAYRQQGFDVYRCAEVALMPTASVESKVSQLRAHWRHWLYLEALAGAALGPLGIGLTLSGLSMICLNWGIQMGWAYGINMESSREQDELRLLVAHGLRDAMGLNGKDPSGLRKITAIGLNVALLSLGQDLSWADKVMATIRHHWRVKSGRLSATHHGISTFRQSLATIRHHYVVEPLDFAHNGRNSDGETRRCAT